MTLSGTSSPIHWTKFCQETPVDDYWRPRLPLYHGGFLYDVEVFELQMEVVFSTLASLIVSDIKIIC